MYAGRSSVSECCMGTYIGNACVVVFFRRRRRSLTRGVCDVCLSTVIDRICWGRGKNKTHFNPTEIVETRILCYEL